VFTAGWAELVLRHPAELSLATLTPRQATLRLAKRLLLLAPEKTAEELESSDSPEGWDPPRVARHVERAVAQAYQAYRRARWLHLLHDCDIVYREPNAPNARLLRLRDGALVEAGEVSPDWAPTERARPTPLPGAFASFDRAKYNRLRVLTTELKRVARDGGHVSVHFGPRQAIANRWLPGLLRLV
jgi:hypothetical protein